MSYSIRFSEVKSWRRLFREQMNECTQSLRKVPGMEWASPTPRARGSLLGALLRDDAGRCPGGLLGVLSGTRLLGFPEGAILRSQSPAPLLPLLGTASPFPPHQGLFVLYITCHFLREAFLDSFGCSLNTMSLSSKALEGYPFTCVSSPCLLVFLRHRLPVFRVLPPPPRTPFSAEHSGPGESFHSLAAGQGMCAECWLSH